MKYSIDNIKEYDDKELEKFRITEQVKLENFEVLLETMMSLPFKNKERFDSIMLKIRKHKLNLTIIRSEIYDRETDKVINIDNSIWISPGINDSNIRHIVPMVNDNNFKEKLVDVEVLDESNNIIKFVAKDDVFVSHFGDYYIIVQEGGYSKHISLNNVISIDLDSKLGEWYNDMSQKFDRELKLKRVLKNKKTEK